MSDRLDYFFRQRVTEAELDLAFELLEKADRDLAADLGIFGIIAGSVPFQHHPVPDLSIDLTSPSRAYDHLGQRIFFGTDQTVDCSVDLVGIPTEVTDVANERWLGVFLRFDRQLSDPRTDGNSQRVYFRRDEAFEVVVRQAPEAAVGAASRVALQDDELLVCDIRLDYGQTQIFEGSIDQSRRQAFIFAAGESVEIEAGAWAVLEPALETAQAAFDEVDAELSDHFTGVARRHPAADIDYAPHGFIAAANVQSAIDEVVDDLSSTAAGDPGAKRVGADAAPGTPHALAAGSVDHQLSQLLAWLNTHLTAASGAHQASALAATPHNSISSGDVQGQLEEIVDDLQSQSAGGGAFQIGNQYVGGYPKELAAGNLLEQLTALLNHLNDHALGGDHDYRYYGLGAQVDDSDRLDGEHASAFALASHDHDGRYVQVLLQYADVFPAGTQLIAGTLVTQPNLISIGYARIDPVTGYPESTVYVQGSLTNDIRVWVTKEESGGNKDYTVTARNGSSTELFIIVTVYG